ncbi:MAG TPA: hypothetical protein PKH94_02435 [Bacteroidales bacterium]|nr:hypothetical protein [Bacteroidales bacterium]HNS46075.1 hypothetical protein [Bacteroidales bacterium]
MKNKNILPVALLILSACSNPRPEKGSDNFPLLEGIYLGQELPGDTVKIFAPGIISTGMEERDVAFVFDGRELFFTRVIDSIYTILHTEETDGRWTEPEVASFSGKYDDAEPIFSTRGRGLYFISNRPSEGKPYAKKDFDIWYTYKTMEGWMEPQPIGDPINTEQTEFFPSVTNDGALYFGRYDAQGDRCDLYRSTRADGKFNKPEKLPEIINGPEYPFNACISPDERYLVFCAIRSDSSFGQSDYYISFRDEDDNWSQPVNPGPEINTSGNEYSPHITPGGKYFFFATNGNPRQINDPAALIDPRLQASAFSAGSLPGTGLPVNGSLDIYWIETHALLKRLRR